MKRWLATIALLLASYGAPARADDDDLTAVDNALGRWDVTTAARELDDVARHGMEMGFMDLAGICPLPDAGRIDDWFASLRLGADFLIAAQNLLQFDPANP